MVNFTCWKHSWIISPNGWDRKNELSSKYTKTFEITLMRDSKRNRLTHRLWSAAKLNSSAVSCSKFCVLHIINNICLNSNSESDTVRLLKCWEKIEESFISNFSSKIRKKIGSKRDNKKSHLVSMLVSRVKDVPAKIRQHCSAPVQMKVNALSKQVTFLCSKVYIMQNSGKLRWF